MTRKLMLLGVALVLGLSALPASAAFENVDVSPRARAMGDAGVAVADDAFAPYFNPAGVAMRDDLALGTSYVRPYGLDFTDLVYLGAVVPLGGKSGGLGFGLRRFAVEYQDVDLTTETTLSLSYAATLYEDLHTRVDAGAGLNFNHLEFAETIGAGIEVDDGLDPGDDWAVGMDVGLMVTLHQRTRIGVMVRNLNNPRIGVDEEELAQRLHGGISYIPYDGVTTTFEFENTLDGELQYHGGVEMTALENLFLRAGVMTNPNKLTAGFGYGMEGLTVDYGFSTGGGTLDSSHQFGLTFAWGGEAP